jgi:hypothetical protein
MTTLLPEGEAIRKAVKWISGELQQNPNRSYQKSLMMRYYDVTSHQKKQNS